MKLIIIFVLGLITYDFSYAMKTLPTFNGMPSGYVSEDQHEKELVDKNEFVFDSNATMEIKSNTFAFSNNSTSIFIEKDGVKEINLESKEKTWPPALDSKSFFSSNIKSIIEMMNYNLVLSLKTSLEKHLILYDRITDSYIKLMDRKSKLDKFKFSSNRKYLALKYKDESKVYVYDFWNNKLINTLKSLDPKSKCSMIFSTNSNLLVIAEFNVNTAQTILTIWNFKTNNTVLTKYFDYKASSIDFSKDGKFLVLAFENSGKLTILDMRFNKISELNIYNQYIWEDESSTNFNKFFIKFLPNDYHCLAVVSTNGFLNMFDLDQDGLHFFMAKLFDEKDKLASVEQIDISNNERYLAILISRNSEKCLKVLDLNTLKPKNLI